MFFMYLDLKSRIKRSGFFYFSFSEGWLLAEALAKVNQFFFVPLKK